MLYVFTMHHLILMVKVALFQNIFPDASTFLEFNRIKIKNKSVWYRQRIPIVMFLIEIPPDGDFHWHSLKN